MRVLLINPGRLPNPAYNGGAVEVLIDQYTKEPQKNIQFTIYSAYSNEVKKNNTSINEYRYIDVNRNPLMKTILYLINKLSKKYIGNYYIRKVISDIKKRKEIRKYDLIIVENICEYTMVLSQKIKAPILLHQHNNFITRDNKWSKKIITSCSKIICVSDFVKKNIIEVCSDANVEVLYNGIDHHKFFYKENLELAKKYKIEKNKDFVFGYVGRVVPEKGIKEILIAFKEIIKTHPNSKLLIIGSNDSLYAKETPFLIECRKLVYDLKDKVIFTGYIPNERVNEYYSLMDVQLVPSVIDDACPMTVMEGLFIGLPQIVSNSGGIPEEVNSKCAIIIKKENLISNLIDAMNKIMNSEKQIIDMKKEALKQAKKFSLSKYQENIIKTIEEFSEESI